MSRTTAPRMKSPDLLPRLKVGRGGGKRRRVEYSAVGVKKRRTSTVQTHTVSVKQIPLPLPTRKMPLTKAYVSSSDSEDEQTLGSPEIERIPSSEQPRSLRVSLTIPPSVDSSPITISHQPSSSPTLSASAPPPVECTTTSPAAPSSENSFVTSSSHQHSPVHSPKFDSSQGLANLTSPVVVEQQQADPLPSLPSPSTLDQSGSHMSDDVFSDVSNGCDKPSVAPPQPPIVDKAKITGPSPPPPEGTLSDTMDTVPVNYFTRAPPSLQSREEQQLTPLLKKKPPYHLLGECLCWLNHTSAHLLPQIALERLALLLQRHHPSKQAGSPWWLSLL